MKPTGCPKTTYPHAYYILENPVKLWSLQDRLITKTKTANMQKCSQTLKVKKQSAAEQQQT